MRINRRLALHSVLLVTFLALPAYAADRVREGQWVGSTTVGGRTFATSSCLSRGDVTAINGDAKAVQSYLEKVIPPEICKITDVRVTAAQIIYTASCASRPAKVVTTSYHGDHSEGTDNTGSKMTGKLVGPCK